MASVKKPKRNARAQPISSSAFMAPRTAGGGGSGGARRKYRTESRSPLTVEVLSSRRM